MARSDPLSPIPPYAGPNLAFLSADRMSQTSLAAAFGSLLGYIGAEAATDVWFERLLWPQRFYSNLSLSSFFMLAFLMPMGGPLHKAALESLDKIFAHGLFKGPHQGHMLGTAFFCQQTWAYKMHSNNDDEAAHTDIVRNCLWTRVLSFIPLPTMREQANIALSDGAEKGMDTSEKPKPQLRARTVVNHLTLSKPTAKDKASQDLDFVGEGVGTPNFNVFLAAFATELSAVATALGVFTVYRSLWSILWLVPLFLRFICTLFALKREPLISTSSSMAADDPSCDFEIKCPQSEGTFMVISGPPVVVLQFFRHYGHPIRTRGREIMQFLMVIAFASQFPIGLLCCALWMPAEVQYVWLCYQLYVVVAMHVLRYSYLGRATTTEAKLAECLSRGVLQRTGPDSAASEAAVLFGHTKGGAETVKASLAVTYHKRYAEGKAAVEDLLSRNKMARTLTETEGLSLLTRSDTTKCTVTR